MTTLMAHQLDNDQNITEYFSDDGNEAIGLIMTYQCNLNCRYCYIKEKKNQSMSFEKAKEIIRPFLLKDGGITDIIFMGAETLLAASVIKKIVEWAEQGVWNRRFRFFGSTNGTLLTDGLKQWLFSHRESIILGLSYDGLPSVQQSNRGCGPQIDLDFFIHTWPAQPVQMTVSAESVSKMAAGVRYLLEKGAVVHPNAAYEKEQWDKKAVIEYGRQLGQLIDYYSRHKNYPYITQFQHDLIEYARNLENASPQPKVCGAGDGFQVFDTDGASYPCHILSPLVLRKDKLDQIQKGVFAQTCDYSDPRCYGCPYRSSCSTCAACNYIYRGSFARRDRTHCMIMHSDVRAFIKMETQRLSLKKSISSEDALEIDAIHRLWHYEQTHAAWAQEE